MGPETGQQAAEVAAEQPAEQLADVIELHPEQAGQAVEAADAEVIPLKPEFAEFATAKSGEQNPQAAAEARAKIATIADLPTEQLIDEYRHYDELSNASRRPNGERIKAKNQLTYGVRAMQRADELKARGVNMDSLSQPQTPAQPEQAAQVAPEKTSKKGIFSFLRRG